MIEALRLEHVFLNRYKLWNINMTVYAGEILALVAQSHTCRQGLIELVSGGVGPDSGRIYLNGEQTQFSSRLDAKRKGIGCIRTHTQLVPSMAVYENIFINREGSYFKRLYSTKFYCRETAQLLAEAGLKDVTPTARIRGLSPATCHMIEMVKATSLRAKILFIENITDRYTDEELKNLMMFMRKLKSRGISVVFLVNKHSALLSVADRVGVLRDGTMAAYINDRDVSKKGLYHYMASLPLSDTSRYREPGKSEIVLETSNLQTDNGRHATFYVCKGEVLGILEPDHEQGLAWGKALCGRQPFSGSIFMNGKPVFFRSPQRARREGMAYVAENEFSNSVFSNMSLLDNVTLMLDPRYNRFGFLNQSVRIYKMKQALEQLGCQDLLEKYGRKKQLGHTNREDQMKITLAKWLVISPNVLVMMNPQLSFSELSMHVFAQMLNVLTEQGMAVIIISTNINSIVQLCDRIISFDHDQEENK